MKLIPKLDPSIPLESILFILYLPLLSSPLRAAPHHRLHSKSSSSQLPHLPPIPPPPPKSAPRPRRGQIEAAAPSRPHRVHWARSGASHRKLRNRWDPNHTDDEDGWRRGWGTTRILFRWAEQLNNFPLGATEWDDATPPSSTSSSLACSHASGMGVEKAAAAGRHPWNRGCQ